MSLRSLVFTTARTGRLDQAGLLRLLAVERARNADLGITGVLALDDVNVFGIVEGPAEVVRDRVREVAADPANVDVQVVLDDPIEHRAFADWSMAFRTDDPAILALPGFVDLFDPERVPGPGSTATRSGALLEWFLRTPPGQLSTRRSTRPVRDRILQASIEVLRDVGPARASLGAVADRAGLSEEEVAKHYQTVPVLLASTLATWLDQVIAPFAPMAVTDGTVAYLRRLVVAFAEDPALDRLIVSSLAPAADPGEPAGEAFLASYRAFRAGIRASLEHDIVVGREPRTMDPAKGAQQLLALFDGLRIQNLFDPEPDVAATFARAAERLRTGWSEPYSS
ncbi:AcrR family transcriptional regulator [Curtobacterium luteum]|uniref:AcrR family transcriptional regulator n=1 Tax=Curtobacterium luteum TaxID=33881 RepID=A0A8H9L0P3_9MICO|nr:BLUF domain-containing protein [Curtobacterium luteum]MBM7802953.1 AcrR family transcriptional regulator [Curtobacterium luteum]NUU49746.1 hypothetical protein [Curtobacterium luteum]GGL01485.1 hypothetical protein GCM10009769_19530 [Curtobacterium luteum]